MCQTKLARQDSRTDCKLNRTYGCAPDGQTMYVSNGCRGQFRFRIQGSSDPPRPLACGCPGQSPTRVLRCPGTGEYTKARAPPTPSSDGDRLHQMAGLIIVVNSVAANVVPRQHIINTLSLAKHSPWESQRILIVVGASSREVLYRSNASGHAMLEVEHNSVDFTALIGLIEHETQVIELLGSFTCLLYLHDTVTVERAFFDRLSAFDLGVSRPLMSLPSLNMGLYMWADVRSRRCSGQLLALKQTANGKNRSVLALKRKGVLWEDAFFRSCIRFKAACSGVATPLCATDGATAMWRVMGPPRPVYSSVLRQERGCTPLGLSKYHNVNQSRMSWREEALHNLDA